MSKISVTTIAGLTSGGDANKVKIESGDTLEVTTNATVGGTLGVTGATTVGGHLSASTTAATVGSFTHGSNTGDTRFELNGPNQYRSLYKHAGNIAGYIGGSGADVLRFSNAAGTTTLEANNGKFTYPLQPSFLARCDTSPAMDIAIVPLAVAVHNIGNHYDTSNYRFTAPVNGRYLLTYSVRANHGTSGHILHPSFYINGSSDSGSRTIYKNDTNAQYMATTFSYVRQLSANDYVVFSMTGGSSGGTLQSGQVSFSGHLLG